MNLDASLAAALAQALACAEDGWALFAPEMDAQGQVIDFCCRYSNPAMQALNSDIPRPPGWHVRDQLPRYLTESPLPRYLAAFRSGQPQLHRFPDPRAATPRWLLERCLRVGGLLAVQIQAPPATDSPSHDRIADRSAELLAHLNAGVVVYNPGGDILTFNLAACSILGLNPEQLRGKALIPAGWQLLSENGDALPAEAHPFRQVLRSGTPVHEFVLAIQAHPDAEPVWCLVNAYPIFDNAQLDAVVVSLIDISHERRLAAVADHHRQRAEALLELNARAQQLSEDALLEEGLKLALHLTGSRMGHIHLIDTDETLRLVVCCQQRQTLAVLDDALPLDQTGSWADALRQGQAVVHNEFAPTLSPKGLPRRCNLLHRHLGAPVQEQGRPVMLLGVANKAAPYDESDRQLLQTLAHDLWKALRQQRTLASWQADRRHLEQVIRASQIAIWEFRLGEQGATALLSHSGHPDHGEEVLLDQFVGLIHPDDQQTVLRAISACLIGRSAHYQQAFRLRETENQPYRWILASGEVIERDASGQPLSMTGTHLDVTEQREVEEQLRLAATVFDSNGEGILITDPQRHILDVNRAFSEVTGYSREEVLGQTPKLLASGQHSREFYAEMWHGLTQSGRWQGEIYNRRKDGTLYPEWLSISTVTNDARQVTHYVGIFSDITERKQQQAHIEFLAFHDPLTGLPNRQLLSDRFLVAHALADRQNQRMALLFLDLDRFKLVNDTLGHQAGDQILIQSAQRLVENVRESDTVCRLGGGRIRHPARRAALAG